jgi:hypothetical protein
LGIVFANCLATSRLCVAPSIDPKIFRNRNDSNPDTTSARNSIAQFSNTSCNECLIHEYLMANAPTI